MTTRSQVFRAAVLAVTLTRAAASAAVPAWVEKSNAEAQPLLRAIGELDPESASDYGLSEYDSRRVYAGLDANERHRKADDEVAAQLQNALSTEADPQVRQDLELMLQTVALAREAIELEHRYLLPYVDPARLIFHGEFSLLNEQAPPARHAAALERLRRYTGLTPGTRPLVEELEAQFAEALPPPGDALEEATRRVGPYRKSVEQNLANIGRLSRSVRELFAKNHLLEGASRVPAEEALAALDRQLAAYTAWTQTVLLSHARADFRSPAPIYALRLRQVGLDVTPDQIITKAELEFSEVMIELQSLAPIVAAQHGWKLTDYRDVINRLKQDQLTRDQVEPYYRNVIIPRLEALIREHRVATLPNRPMAMRIASEGESAVQPAPHMQPPTLLNNHGEHGTFVLPLDNPGGKDSADLYDDFTFKAGTWTLTAHEGRPGHELQFDRMVERGVSIARSLFAFNSVNVEGWALYCESEMKPYEPVDAQMIVLQLRLLRAARAICDPMMNLGRMSRERAHEILVKDVCLSEAFAREELDRFSYRLPGQATSYFYGYSRLLELRAATQIALGPRFDRLAFNDFIVDQGLLPPNLLAAAVKKWSASLSE